MQINFNSCRLPSCRGNVAVGLNEDHEAEGGQTGEQKLQLR